MHRTGHQTVHFAAFQHHGAEHHVVFQLFFSDHFGHAFVLTQFDQARNVVFTRYFRIDNFNAAVQHHTLRSGNAFDLFWIAQQHAGGDASFSTD